MNPITKVNATTVTCDQSRCPCAEVVTNVSKTPDVLIYDFDPIYPYTAEMDEMILSKKLTKMPTDKYETEKYKMLQLDGTEIIVTLEERKCGFCGDSFGLNPCLTERCDPDHWFH